MGELMSKRYIYKYGDDYHSSYKKAYDALSKVSKLPIPSDETMKRLNKGRCNDSLDWLLPIRTNYYKGTIIFKFPDGNSIIQSPLL